MNEGMENLKQIEELEERMKMKIINPSSLMERHTKLAWLLEDLLKQDEREMVNDLKQVFHFARNQLNLIKEYKPLQNHNGITDWKKRKRNLPFICEGKIHMRGYK